MFAQESEPFAHLAQEATDRGFSRGKIMAQFDRAREHMPPLTHGEVAGKRNDVGADVDEQHSAESDMFIDKSDQGTGNEPATLNSGEKKGIRLHERALRGQFLNERGDGRPEHPEAGGDERVHQIELPYLDAVENGEDGDYEDDDRAQGIEPHHEAPPVFTI